jgi:hypothetical protein
MKGGSFSLNLKRFGLWPPKRLIGTNDLPPTIVNSIPKSGTHLVETMLCETGSFYRPFYPTFNTRLHTVSKLRNAIRGLRSGQVLFAHFPFSEDLQKIISATNCKLIFVVRDPRDVVISNAHFIPTLHKHVHFAALASLSFEERLDILIRGSQDLKVPSIFDKTAPFVDWMDHADHVVHFEKLSRNAEVSEKLEATNALYKALSITEVATMPETGTSSTTFRKGVSGDWVKVLSAEQQNLFLESDMLFKLGYR